jgi:[acyl-carrier-protein] S-malonyltransferase
MKVGMVFSGYGSQFVGMGKELYDGSRTVQEIFEEAASCLDTNFVKLCFASADADIKQIEQAYITLFIVGTSIAKVLKEAGIEPAKVAGYDMGEYAAIASIQGINNPDALYLLKKYANLYQALIDEKKYILVRITGMEESAVKAMCMQVTGGQERADIAVYELETSFVLSGTHDALQKIVEAVKRKKGVKAKVLDAGSGLHSPVMDNILKNVKMYLEKVDFKDTQVPFISGVIGEPLQTGETIRAALMQHIHAPTQWAKVMQNFSDCDIILEVGPGEHLQELLTQVYPDKKIYRVLTPEDVKRVQDDLGIVPVDTSDSE